MANYRTNDGKIVEFSFNELFRMADKSDKIPLIKLLRSVSGMGLKDVKDSIEYCQTHSHPYEFDK